MKKNSVIGLLLLLSLAACTPYMYGVPQESWDRMSEAERIEGMQIYERNEQARRQAAEEQNRHEAREREHAQIAEERARSQAIEEQARRQAAEERIRHEARERERRENIREPEPPVGRDRKPPASTAVTSPFISGKTLRWESDAQGGQKGTIYVTSTDGSSFYLDQKNNKNKAAGIIKLEGKIENGKIIIKNSKLNETWVGTLKNGTVSGKINNKNTFRITE